MHAVVALDANINALLITIFALVVYRYERTTSGGWTFANKLLNGGCDIDYANYISVNGAGTELMISMRCNCVVYYYTKPLIGGWSAMQTLSQCAYSVAMCGNTAFVGSPQDTVVEFTGAGD